MGTHIFRIAMAAGERKKNRPAYIGWAKKGEMVHAIEGNRKGWSVRFL